MADKGKRTAKPQVVTLPIKDVKPYWRNPRINRDAVPKVKESIQKYGYNQLIAVDKKNVIVVGHTRYLALVELGYTEIAIIRLDLSDKEAQAYRIVDNKTAEFSSWSDELPLELRALESDLTGLQTFFKDDLGALMGKSAGQDAKDVTKADITDAAAKQTEVGDKHRLLQEVVCPGCGHEFITSAATVKRVFVEGEGEGPSPE